MAYERNLDTIFGPPICSSPSQSGNPTAYNAAIEIQDGVVIKSILFLELVCVHNGPRKHSVMDYLHGIMSRHTNRI